MSSIFRVNILGIFVKLLNEKKNKFYPGFTKQKGLDGVSKVIKCYIEFIV